MEVKELKKPLTFEEQVVRLKEHGVLISDKSKAQEILSKINYYRLSGYAYQFKKDSDDYREGTSFDQIVKIHELDQKLRNLLRQPLEIIELWARTQIAYHFSISRCLISPHDGHYNSDNFYRKDMHKKVLDGLEKDLRHNKDIEFIKHHQNIYGGRMPLWVMVEVLSFSNLSKLYSSMTNCDQDRISSALGTETKYLINNLHCVANLRNICSHGGRLYNRIILPEVKLAPSYYRLFLEQKNDSLAAFIIALLRLLPEDESKKSLITDIDRVCCEYKDEVDMAMYGFSADYIDKLKKIFCV